MENNEPSQPPPPPPAALPVPPPLPPPPAMLLQPPPVVPDIPLYIYDYNPPYNAVPYGYLITSFPLTITLYNFNINNTHLQFTFTDNSITITPIHATQNHNNISDDDTDDDTDDDSDDDSNEAEGIDLMNNDDNDDDGANDDNNNNYNDEHDNGNVEIRFYYFTDMNGVRQYGLRIPTLPTLPAYINIGINNIVLLINSGPSVHLISPAPPLPFNPIHDAAENNNNNEAISYSITMPFGILFPFNDPNTNTIINIIIHILGNYIHVRASTEKGVTAFVAYFAMFAPQP